jgi:hypothetical protein
MSTPTAIPSPLPAPTATPLPTPSPEPPLITSLPPTATLVQAYPFTLGAQWVYSITSVTGTPGHIVTMTGYLTQTVVDVSEQKGMQVFRIWSEQDSSLSDFPHTVPLQYHILFQDALYWWNSDDPTSLISDLAQGRATSPELIWPLKVGQMFSSISAAPRTDRMYAWDVVSQEGVSTPAGRFGNCFHLIFSTNPDDSQAWFCPGTGFVQRAYRHHGSIGDLRQVLVSHQIVAVTDDHADDAAINVARLRLSQSGHTDPMLATVVYVTPTMWLDDCLGLPAAVACHRKQTPGYLLELEKGGQLYRFRTDKAGQQARLEWSSIPPMSDAFVQWRYTDSSGCHATLIGPAQTQYGMCGEALLTVTQSPMSSANAGLKQANVGQLFKPFTASTVHGTLVYSGSGAIVVSPAQQRAIAEWAAMRYAEADAGYLSADHGLALVWRERSAAVCGGLWIYKDGVAAAWDCAGKRVVGTGLLSAADLEQFYKWLDSGKQWNIAHIPLVGDGQPDATLSLPQNDVGGSVTHEDADGLLTFARAVYAYLSSACPVRMEGRLTTQDGQMFIYRMLAPADWADKLDIRVERNIVYVDYRGSQKETLFLVAALTEAQWQEDQKWPGNGTVLSVNDGIIFVYNSALANPFTNREADEFSRMGSQVRAVVASLEVTRVP